MRTEAEGFVLQMSDVECAAGDGYLPMLCVELGWSYHPACYSMLDGSVPDRALPVSPQHPDTSQTMRAAVLKRGTIRHQVFGLFLNAPEGLTDYDIAKLLGRSHQSVSSARNSLARDKRIRDSGKVRMNEHGNDAIVWVLA